MVMRILQGERPIHEGHLLSVRWEGLVAVVHWAFASTSATATHTARENTRLRVSCQIDTPQIADTSVCIDEMAAMDGNWPSRSLRGPVVCVGLNGLC